jgi:putative hydrolase of the HAD superfamily
MNHRKSPNLNQRLVRRIQSLSRPLAPQSTGRTPAIRQIPGVRAVIFDVYGTLLVSASGDIGRDGNRRRNQALTESFRSIGVAATSRGAVRQGIECLDRAVADAQMALRKKGCQNPEIDIRRMWSAALKKLAGRGMIVGPVNSEMVQTLAVEYECRVNPVWPMPGLRRTLRSLRRAGIVLGIVSNAQFYTPLILDSFPETGWAARWFDKKACVWSYRLREAKPSPRLLAAALNHLRLQHGIKPGEILCVGNDMLNDILPAAKTGCRTALFAGDRRSYRPRKKEFAHEDQRPDVVILSLPQLSQVITPKKIGRLGLSSKDSGPHARCARK